MGQVSCFRSDSLCCTGYLAAPGFKGGRRPGPGSPSLGSADLGTEAAWHSPSSAALTPASTGPRHCSLPATCPPPRGFSFRRAGLCPGVKTGSQGEATPSPLGMVHRRYPPHRPHLRSLQGQPEPSAGQGVRTVPQRPTLQPSPDLPAAQPARHLDKQPGLAVSAMVGSFERRQGLGEDVRSSL